MKEAIYKKYIGKKVMVYKTTFPTGIEWKEVKFDDTTNSPNNKIEQCGMKVVDVVEDGDNGYCLMLENDFYLYLN